MVGLVVQWCGGLRCNLDSDKQDGYMVDVDGSFGLTYW